MEIKYIIKATARTRSLFLVRDVEVFGNVVPFAFRDCEQQEWKIAKFDTKEEAIAACEEARKYDGADYTPIILEALVQEESD
ncbi:hypothetical protein [Paraprevotella xylaniphila]|uniref:hypothetical protein n=1 Tax=Paraprevotella xylaniphila TaxID=454155 RepID=UPI00266688F5|nr:hypothetical protein [Paraprevotella xylaniphila]